MVSRGIGLLVGGALVAAGLEDFLIPNHVIDGGITGISIICSHLFGIPIGAFLFVLNLPFLFIGYRQVGKTFALSTLFAITLISILATVMGGIGPATKDPLLASVFGGIIVGIGVGLIIRNGGSSDGTEVVAVLLNEKTPWSVGEIVMFFNVFILGSAGFVFGWNHAMYSLIAYFIGFKTIDITLTGFEETKSIWVITDRHEEIGEAIIQRLGRGVTYLNGQGAFTGESRQVVFSVISRLEEAKLKSIVEEKDPSAFLAIGPIAEVRGGRFKKHSVH
ncbi:YitT family protein [Alicyclobacillus ferrooxydans]|uniref:DUF2179 domain-containing protein n=1 Tax=Alicyclobacillus ferrooxydans TaxID=471514 RepID=A0A0P9CE79_9BACL|nr:YitT family protein [Alicyclobacillus ferrooxydans]KPV43911.1 hypothetical protein AN477_10095 [Alicyclobacillus ferrooxydans]